VSEDPDRLVPERDQCPASISMSPAMAAGGCVYIPELGGLTQTRYPREVELMARGYIAVSDWYAHRPGGDQLASVHAMTRGD